MRKMYPEVNESTACQLPLLSPLIPLTLLPQMTQGDVNNLKAWKYGNSNYIQHYSNAINIHFNSSI